jgi:outer membrane protein OmpA-like peptidoglycan-associated protein
MRGLACSVVLFLSGVAWADLRCPDGGSQEPRTLGQTLTFAVGSTRLSAKSRVLLDTAAEILTSHTEVGRVVVTGAASPDEPRRLALARAKVARRYLVKRGIAPRRLATAASGDAPQVTLVVQPFCGPSASGTGEPLFKGD